MLLKTPGLVSGSVMGAPVILPRFNWSAAVARDFHEALELGALVWYVGNHGEAFMQDLRAAMDVAALGAAVAVESGIGAAMVLGAVLPRLGGGAAGSGAVKGVPELGGFAHGISDGEIEALNRSLGGTTTIAGHPSSALAAAARQQGFFDKSAAIIREIAGRHMVDDANKTTAQAVYKVLAARNRIAGGVSSV
ncbi:hypothetical protein [Sorangium sp. So ce1078]|uniref:hypothetical protein n=1 Tax=Sorangium sp. So ce1078 TaxID=3133329 RepID=UPI003F638C37